MNTELQKSQSIGIQAVPKRKNARVQIKVHTKDKGNFVNIMVVTTQYDKLLFCAGIQTNLEDQPTFRDACIQCDIESELWRYQRCSTPDLEQNTSDEMYSLDENSSVYEAPSPLQQSIPKYVVRLFFCIKNYHFILFRKFPDQEAKYIVFESCLLALFMSCPLCNCKIDPNILTVGTMVCVTQICGECGYHSKWESQPMIKNVPAGNLLLSAAILFAGAQPTKTLRVLNFLGCAAIKSWTFYEHQRFYLHQAISTVWSQNQMAMIRSLQASDEPIAIGGDGRSDSPGHCAKYGAYSFMDLKHNVVLDIELVQVNIHAIVCQHYCNHI